VGGLPDGMKARQLLLTAVEAIEEISCGLGFLEMSRFVL
jgi:transcriptional regulator GlxA family with amidase domain